MAIADPITRREVLAGLPVAAGLATMAPAAVRANAATSVSATAAFPPGFLWGAATSGHQVEGNNVNSDVWFAEHVKPTVYREPSGDACNHYHLYRDDIALMSKLGLNFYRFSLEWSRVEPEPGEFSIAELDHYRRVLMACHEFGIKTWVTFNHLTTPRWFAALGGWENPQSPVLFARYCARANAHLGDLITVGATFNEPCLGGMLKWLGIPPAFNTGVQAMFRAAAKACGAERFSMLLSMDEQKLVPQLLEAHRRGAEALRSGRARYPVGLTLNVADDQSVGPDSLVDKKRAELYAPFLEAAKAQDDYIGVQNYGRLRYDRTGRVRPASSDPDSDAFAPESLGVAVRYVAQQTGKPVYISENGIATDDDTRRVEFIRRAVASVKQAIDDKVDVRSYVHWSLLDNFEWTSGYSEKLGLIAVDRTTFKRSVKPSAVYLGQLARRNAV